MYEHCDFAIWGARKEAMEKILGVLIDRGWFQPCQAEWASPYLVVPKNRGRMAACGRLPRPDCSNAA